MHPACLTLLRLPFRVSLHLLCKNARAGRAGVCVSRSKAANSTKLVRSSIIPKRSQKSSAQVFLAAAIILLGSAITPQTQGQTGPEGAQTGVSVEASPQIFSVMCALEAAGFAADESTLSEMPSRLALRGELLKLQGPATDALRQFYRDYALSDPGETLSRYITFSLVIGPPPSFTFLLDHDVLPPDALAIEGFQEVLANFYHEAHLDLRWASVEPEYNRAVERYQSPVRRVVTVSNAYLREIYTPRYSHSFTVYIEPLVGNRTNFRNNGNHYAIVVDGGPEFPEADIRHAYLHFLLDPLPLKYRESVMKKRGLLNIAARAPRLSAEYKNDFMAYADECLIKAVELRIRHLKPDKEEAVLVEDDQAGFIMVRSFVAQLQKFEKAEPAMSYYFPDLIDGINLEAEQKRLQNFQFAALPEMEAKNAAPGSARGGLQPGPAATPQSELESALAQGDHEIALQDAAAAGKTFEKILAKYPDNARANFGLAVASLLNHDADRAQELFEKLVAAPPAAAAAGQPPSEASPAPDPSIVSWSHVYLGRLHDFAEERDQALTEYRAALAIDGAPEAARVAAQRGIDAPYNPRGTSGSSGASGASGVSAPPKQ
jgi:tetratricopeptide (TPR) repeat protein